MSEQGSAPLYLILHKVRGEPTFDVAHQLTLGHGEVGHSEVCWIIPTSGHRAYPWRYWLLEDLKDTSDINYQGYHDTPWDWLARPIPDGVQDHYGATPSPSRRPSPEFDIALLFS